MLKGKNELHIAGFSGAHVKRICAQINFWWVSKLNVVSINVTLSRCGLQSIPVYSCKMCSLQSRKPVWHFSETSPAMDSVSENIQAVLRDEKEEFE
jgi:hypothetical protein